MGTPGLISESSMRFQSPGQVERPMAMVTIRLTAAQAAIWPARKGSDAAKAKRRVAKAIDDRACRGDPLNMQAAVRMTFEDASWLARYVDADAHIPTWIEIV